jgi:hypothetical protein
VHARMAHDRFLEIILGVFAYEEITYDIKVPSE